MKKKSSILHSVVRNKMFAMIAFLCISGDLFSKNEFLTSNYLTLSSYNVQLSESLNLKLKEVNVSTLFGEIEKRTDYKFVYDRSILSVGTLFTFEEKEIRLEDLLHRISKVSELQFKQVNKNIIAKRNENIHTPEIQNLVVDVPVKGTVVDNKGIPLPGVTVLVPGTGIGTVTDIDGNYSLNVDEGSTLVFSFVGFSAVRVAIAGKSIINVTLEEDISALEEVVVMGYGTQKRSDITGAIGMVGAKEFEDEPIIQVGQALQGKVAGLQVSQNSGAPGSGILIRIRGTGTVNNAEPLYVVDGNPNANPLDLVPEQIESIQVLKSASAAAIYGAQGANGVILITTKQGKAGKSQLDVNFSQGFQQIQKEFPVTNAREYAILYNEGLVNAGQKPLYPNPDALGEGTNWQKEVFQIAPMTEIGRAHV